MSSVNYLDSIVAGRTGGQPLGITSVCSAHPMVLQAALRCSLQTNSPALFEATCNQVNQFGGYTGKTPADFAHFVDQMACQAGLPRQDLILGGDHLGPLPWADEPAHRAMEKAKALVHDYVRAGFGKIHLDCSMPCRDDRELPVERVARRAAELAQVAEQACREAGLPHPRYVIGTEVPPAGGAHAGEAGVRVTSPQDAATTLDVSRQAFATLGLDAAWERVIALVVQPGVEFGDAAIHDYDPLAARDLVRFIESIPGIVLEAHSTDYQTPHALGLLVRDHFAILKVGPGLTFAFREGVFALAEIEKALVREGGSHIREVLEAAMVQNPIHWRKHYRGTEAQQAFSRQYSFSDRLRYYWGVPEVQAALQRVLGNLGRTGIPLALVSQYFPGQFAQIRAGAMTATPENLLLARVTEVLQDYARACRGGDR